MYRVHLKNFDGPLDLLLYFIRRDEIDIYDIPIASITGEYLETLNLMKSLNLNIAGEFIVMAATLVRIKAKMMIPRPAPDEDDDYIDPRAELVHQLLEFQQFKDAARQLEDLADERQRQYPLGQRMKPPQGEEDLGVFFRDVSLYDLARLFRDTMERMPVIRSYELERDPIHLEQQRAFILAAFDGEGRLRFSSLLKKMKSKIEVLVTFLAVLELIRERQVTIVQEKLFGHIELHLQKEPS